MSTVPDDSDVLYDIQQNCVPTFYVDGQPVNSYLEPGCENNLTDVVDPLAELAGHIAFETAGWVDPASRVYPGTIPVGADKTEQQAVDDLVNSYLMDECANAYPDETCQTKTLVEGSVAVGAWVWNYGVYSARVTFKYNDYYRQCGEFGCDEYRSEKSVDSYAQRTDQCTNDYPDSYSPGVCSNVSLVNEPELYSFACDNAVVDSALSFVSNGSTADVKVSHLCVVYLGNQIDSSPSFLDHTVRVTRNWTCPHGHISGVPNFSCDLVNTPPIVTPTTAPEALINTTYQYTPTVTDDGHPLPLEYRVVFQPSWLNLNTFTGQLSGNVPPSAGGGVAFLWYASDGLDEVMVDVNFNVNRLPTANAGADQVVDLPDGTPSVTATFIGSAYDADGDPLIYTWDFGDESYGSGSTASHTYTQAGTYTVTFYVSDGKNPAVSDSLQILVNDNPTARAGGPYNTNLNIPVQFSASTSFDSTPTGVLTYQWDFGDGSPVSTLENPTHTFVTAPSQDVTLTVSDGRLSSTVAVTVNVFDETAVDGLDVGLNNGPADCNGSNPINGATGNKYQLESDYTGAGHFPLVFNRHYNSYTPESASLGRNWRHTYERSVVIDASQTPNVARVYRQDGVYITYINNTGSWVPRSSTVTERLVVVTPPSAGVLGVWQFIDNSDNVETFTETAFGSGSGRLTEIKTSQGFTQTLAYFANGKLETVTSQFGQQLSFTYDTAGRLDTVTDPADRIINYDYDSFGNLEYVTYQSTPQLIRRQYIYDHNLYANLLTGIVDENNNRYATFTYDAMGRATSSFHATGANTADTVTFDYSAVATSAITAEVGDPATLAGVTNITDSKNETRTYAYTNEDGKIKVRMIDGQECQVCGVTGGINTYDANGFPDIVKDFKGIQTDYNYNARGLPEQRIEALGTAEQRTFTTQWHNDYRVPLCVIEPRKSIKFDYFPGTALLQTRTEIDTTPDGTDPNCDVAILNPALKKRAWNYTYYDATHGIREGLLRTVDGPRVDVSDVTTYIYNVLNGNLTDIQGPLYPAHPATAIRDYDAHGRARTITDPNGLVTRIAYTIHGQKDIVSVGDGAGNGEVGDSNTNEITDYSYDNMGFLTGVIMPDKSTINYVYDDAHRLSDVYDQHGNLIHYGRDTLGNATLTETYSGTQNGDRSTGTLRRKVQKFYTQHNRLERIEGAGTPPQVTRFINIANGGNYDANGNRLYREDPSGNITRYAYDALNRLETITDAKLGVTRYTYHADGRTHTVTDPNNVITTYSYDGLGNLTQVDSADIGVVKYTDYDEAGNLKRKVDANNIATNYTQYDALNRLVTVSYGADVQIGEQVSRSTTYNYDTGPNAIGRLNSITQNATSGIQDNSSLQYGYDSHGRINNKVQVLDSVALAVDYNYDTEGKLETINYPSGQTIKYNYTNSEVSSIQFLDGPNIISNMSYEPFGPLSGWTAGATNVSKTHDLDGQISGFTLSSTEKTLEYYPTGNLENIIDQKNIIDQNSAVNNENYVYDSMLRLSDYTGPKGTQAFVYDNGGAGNSNRTEKTTDGTVETSTYTTGTNQLLNSGVLAASILYDDAGNTTNDGTFAYSYGGKQRLNRVTNTAGTVEYARYTLNELGQRIGKRSLNGIGVQPGDANGDGVINQQDLELTAAIILGTATSTGDADCNQDFRYTVQDLVCVNYSRNSNGRTVYYFYNEAGQLLGEYNQFGVVIREYIWFGNTPVAIITGGQVYHIHSDHLNTPREVTNSANTVVWRWVSDPFGEALAEEDPDGDGIQFHFNFRFPGQYFDVETGLHYNYHRTYNPRTGRYLEVDPIGLEGGVNLYAYVLNNPILGVDRFGLDSTEEAPNPHKPQKPEVSVVQAICTGVIALDSECERQKQINADLHKDNMKYINMSCEIHYQNCRFEIDEKFYECVTRERRRCAESVDAELRRNQEAKIRIEKNFPVNSDLKKLCDML